MQIAYQQKITLPYSFSLKSPYELIAGTANFSRLATVKVVGNAADDAFTDEGTTGVDKHLQQIVLNADCIHVNVGHFSRCSLSVTLLKYFSIHSLC